MEYFLKLFSILMVNILLSGDNALVIALASRDLPAEHKKTAILLGSAGAIGLRILLTFIAVMMLKIPFLQLMGGLVLLWIAIKLIGDSRKRQETIIAKSNLWDAVKTIIIADLVMSLDNVIAIAGIAKGSVSLIVIGLAMSIPIIIWGSQLIGLLMIKWPIIVIVGAAFLGWTAGEMVITDIKLLPMIEPYAWAHWMIPSGCAVIVILLGTWMSNAKSKMKKHVE